MAVTESISTPLMRAPKLALAKRLTPVSEAHEKHQVLGVALVILNKAGEVLTLKENTDKAETAKKKGEYGVLCETVESRSKGEQWEQAALRGLSEELGIPPLELGKLFSVNAASSYLGEGVVSNNILARVYEIYFLGSDENLQDNIPHGEEVSLIGWVKPADLQKLPLRDATKTLLASYFPSAPGSFAEHDLLPLSLESLREAQLRCTES